MGHHWAGRHNLRAGRARGHRRHPATRLGLHHNWGSHNGHHYGAATWPRCPLGQPPGPPPSPFENEYEFGLIARGPRCNGHTQTTNPAMHTKGM